MPKVLNARQAGTKPAADRVYVGRPSRWSNPFVLDRDGMCDEVGARLKTNLKGGNVGGQRRAHVRRAHASTRPDPCLVTVPHRRWSFSSSPSHPTIGRATC